MAPAPDRMIRARTSSVEIFSSEPTMASADPCTSAFTITGSSRTVLACSLAIMSASEAPAAGGAMDLSRRLRSRYSVSSRARASFSTTAKASPGSGVESRPRISTGSEGPAVGTCSSRSLIRARTRPQADPATTMSPRFSVPRLTRAVATGPRPRSSLASITTPSAVRSGLALRSMTSDCSKIASTRSSSPSFWVAETWIACTSPPRLSTTISCWSSSLITRVGSASGLSILLMATMIGAPAALA